jgi:AraC-like DNA-binding protein
LHDPHPLESYEQHKIILAVVHYFSEHYNEAITIPGLSKQLGISLLHIETAFDLYKGKTANQALLEYRLNRLCDLMSKDPSQEIGEQIKDCGLSAKVSPWVASFAETNTQFIACFGIDLIEYHQQCFLAKADRLQSQKHTISTNDADNEAERIGSPQRDTLLMTRFHCLP